MIGPVTTGRRPRSRRRIILAVVGLGALAAIVAVAVVVVPLVLPPGPRPAFQLPVTCGETWQLGTYPGHGEFEVDLFPTSGDSWGRPVLASYDGTVKSAGINGTVGGRNQQTRRGPAARAAATG